MMNERIIGIDVDDDGIEVMVMMVQLVMVAGTIDGSRCESCLLTTEPTENC